MAQTMAGLEAYFESEEYKDMLRRHIEERDRLQREIAEFLLKRFATLDSQVVDQQR